MIFENSFLKTFDSFWLSFAETFTTGACNFVSLIVKLVLSELELSLSLPPLAKTPCFVHLSF